VSSSLLPSPSSSIPTRSVLLRWLLKDQIVAAVEREIDQAADDGAALSEAQRQQQEATIIADTLTCSRAECAVIWSAESKGEIIDFPPRHKSGCAARRQAYRRTASGAVAGHIAGACPHHGRAAMMMTDSQVRGSCRKPRTCEGRGGLGYRH
jgi:hypothetical protein